MKSLRFQLKNPHSSWFNQLFHHLLRPGRSSASYKSQRREMLRRAARCVRPGGVVARDHKGAADAGEMRFSVFFCVISYQPKYIHTYIYIYIYIITLEVQDYCFFVYVIKICFSGVMVS
jgi:hypothetical protein